MWREVYHRNSANEKQKIDNGKDERTKESKEGRSQIASIEVTEVEKSS